MRDSRLVPPLRWRKRVRSPARTSTRAPTASRLLMVPTRRQANPVIAVVVVSLRAEPAAVLVVDDEVDIAVVVEVAERPPRARHDPSSKYGPASRVASWNR